MLLHHRLTSSHTPFVVLRCDRRYCGLHHKSTCL